MIRVRVIGELSVDRDGVELALPKRRPARLLLGWLALHPGSHARSMVASSLWPNVLDESARTSLRTALSALRSAIGGSVLSASRERIGLDGEVTVDWREFQQIASEGRALDALDLYSGELLAGFDEEWALSARDAFRDQVGVMLASLAADAATAGESTRAISFARRRAALDPLDEQAHADLMRRLADAGDRAGALNLYERLAERLRRELGIAPSSAVRQLAAELRGAPTPHTLPPPLLPARIVAARARGPLIGREAEFAKLHGAWSRSGAQRRQLALVSGEPGIGKTRLVCEFAASIDNLGATVLYGRAEEEALVPYQPFVEALRDPLPAPLTTSRLQLFEAIGDTLDTVAAGRHVLLVLDDLHWAEPPTIRLLRHLAARSAGAPRMIIATYRDTEESLFAASVASLYRELAVERIALGGLDHDAVATLLGGERSSDDVRALREQTGGNPFFIEQLLPGDPIGVTDTVSRRIAALGPEAHAVLDAAAVSGAEFELETVSEVVGLPVDATLDVLDAAVRARLVGEIPDEPGRYAFVHAIVRDTLASSLTAARRTRLHELFAASLEDRARREPNRYLVALANHALEAAAGAGDPIEAAGLAERAAGRAGAVLAHEDAAALLSRALSVLERRGSSLERRAELQSLLGQTLARAGLTDEARQALARGIELARATDRVDLVARSALASGGAGITILGADVRMVSVFEQALAAIGDDHPGLRVRLLARLAIELAYEPESGRRDAISQEAFDLAHRIDDPGALAAALNARHVIAWGPDGCEERLALADEMLSLADRAGEWELSLQARNWRIVDLLELGDGPAVREDLDAYAELCARTRIPAFAWYVPLWRATLATLEGRIADGLDLSRRARDLGRHAGDANTEGFFAEQYLLRMVVQGRIGDLEPTSGGGDADIPERAESGPAWRAFRFTFAWWHAARGELDAARRDFEAAVADGLSTVPRDVNWLAALTSATEACVLLEDAARAAELRLLLEPYAGRMVVTARGASHGGSVAYSLARLAALCGDSTDADALFAEAARRDEHAGASAFVVRDLWHHGEFLRAIGQHDRADGIRAQAAEKARSLGFTYGAGDD
jgi:DNA-binding SARP family transcriptional activator